MEKKTALITSLIMDIAAQELCENVESWEEWAPICLFNEIHSYLQKLQKLSFCGVTLDCSESDAFLFFLKHSCIIAELRDGAASLGYISDFVGTDATQLLILSTVSQSDL